VLFRSLDIGIYPVFIALSILGLPHSIKAIASFTENGVDGSCSILFQHDNQAISILFSSLETDGRNEALIHGSEGIIKIISRWHMPTTLDLMKRGEKTEHFSFFEPGNGYQYEALEVMKCLDSGKMESSVFSWQDSQNLISTLDAIRKDAGIKYPDSIEKL
jgi:scyllo-inositol 2-dehydrogenase (NADP+)